MWYINRDMVAVKLDGAYHFKCIPVKIQTDAVSTLVRYDIEAHICLSPDMRSLYIIEHIEGNETEAIRFIEWLIFCISTGITQVNWKEFQEWCKKSTEQSQT